MSESNGAWGQLAAHDDEFAQAWDSYEYLPEPGTNQVLDAFCNRKHIDIPSLLKLGARLAEPDVIAIAYDQGIKFRNMVDGRKWSYIGSTWPHMKIVRAEPQRTKQVIVCEGETDGARLAKDYDIDVAIMPAGAEAFFESMAQQLEDYEHVLLALDKDTAGENGCAKIAQYHNNTVRFPAPGAGDWADVDGALPDLPELVERPEPVEDLSSEILVPAGAMLEMEIPEIPSWLEHDILPIAGQMILHGWSKSFKSFMALDLVTQLAQGQDWCMFEPTEEPVRVGIMQFEITWPYYHKRMSMLRNNARDVDAYNANVYTWTPMKRPEIVAGNKKHEDHILKTLTDANIQIVLIDPIRRAVGNADLNAENEVRKMLRFFERMQDEGITVIATHHDNKEGAKAGGGSAVSMTGSGAFSGDADTIVSVELPKGESLNTSRRRNLNFTLRNSPAVGPRSMEITEEGRIIYDSEPSYAEETENEDAVDPNQPKLPGI